jgi:hypothetical protein
MKTTAGSIALLLFFGLASPIAHASSSESEEDAERTAPQSEVDDTQGRVLFQAFGVGMFAASAGDLATTEWGLTKPGIYETNPLATNRGARVTAHVLVPAVVYWTTSKMRKNGHRKAALWVRIAVTAAYGYAVMHNLRTASR